MIHKISEWKQTIQRNLKKKKKKIQRRKKEEEEEEEENSIFKYQVLAENMLKWISGAAGLITIGVGLGVKNHYGGFER